ncbi:histidinol-phosphate aminotransferase [Tritrichomonas foetus]|uniref:Histidinol-phosphate aminotransferase n=1 Tax=Tritrichomonas foetus TaxID=1144522 RepID=A0A1J4KR18_9EUKA|nr:histidinol-phosphate aminotransferase [Tritrichomonas foetus]|eukprot:OHT13703.1 histidinol-phosphate aminotransferase [Tritrichomonas foetus]
MIDPVVAKFSKPEVQCFHGGQSYSRCPNFKSDFSVTTNVMGPPKDALAAAIDALKANIEHYPDQEAWPVRCHFANVMNIKPEEVLIGNGASELIEIVPRLYPEGTKWRGGYHQPQYMEYERAALNANLEKVPTEKNDEAKMIIMINPNSPTGDYIPFEELRQKIKDASDTVFIIDESFISCIGPDWINHSAIRLVNEFAPRVWVIASWTKVFACPFIRIGTLVSCQENIEKVQKLQVPWSVNGAAQAFIISAINDKKFFEEMWKQTPVLKANQIKLLDEVGFKANPNSPLWVPYIYVDFLNEEITQEAERIAFEAGYPIRVCKSYGAPHHVRLGIRLIEHQEAMQKAWLASEKLKNLISEYKRSH